MDYKIPVQFDISKCIANNKLFLETYDLVKRFHATRICLRELILYNVNKVVATAKTAMFNNEIFRGKRLYLIDCKLMCEGLECINEENKYPLQSFIMVRTEFSLRDVVIRRCNLDMLYMINMNINRNINISLCKINILFVSLEGNCKLFIDTVTVKQLFVCGDCTNKNSVYLCNVRGEILSLQYVTQLEVMNIQFQTCACDNVVCDANNVETLKRSVKDIQFEESNSQRLREEVHRVLPDYTFSQTFNLSLLMNPRREEHNKIVNNLLLNIG